MNVTRKNNVDNTPRQWAILSQDESSVISSVMQKLTEADAQLTVFGDLHLFEHVTACPVPLSALGKLPSPTEIKNHPQRFEGVVIRVDEKKRIIIRLDSHPIQLRGPVQKLPFRFEMKTSPGYVTFTAQGEPQIAEFVKFHDLIKDKAQSALLLVVDLTQITRLPNLTSAIMGDLIEYLSQRKRKVAIINSLSLGTHFLGSYPNTRFVCHVNQEGEAMDFFQSNPLRILAVEDEETTQLLIATCLTQQYLQPVLASTAEEGIVLAREKQPDLILMDHYLPGLSGIEAVRILREDPLTASIPILMFTSDSEQETVMEAMQLRVDGYLLKPLHPEKFIQRIAKTL
ncbi:MAG TPA: response regulator [bacterium]|nr:response regulator [bacterium]HPP01755.1 response regulator [bacterium]